MNDLILQNLDDIERTEGVRIFFACESGSRAWGFPSADSDYDMRFLYVRPVDWYLSIDEGRDVIEKPITIAQQMRDLVPIFYSRISSTHHYLQMARRNFKEYLLGDQVWTKKYLYVLRPLLAVQWIERDLGVVPTDFNVMVNRLVPDGSLRTAIDDLLAKKRSGVELDSGPRVEPISHFIESELARWETATVPSETGHGETEMLNQLFRNALAEVWRVQRSA